MNGHVMAINGWQFLSTTPVARPLMAATHVRTSPATWVSELDYVRTNPESLGSFLQHARKVIWEHLWNILYFISEDLKFWICWKVCVSNFPNVQLCIFEFRKFWHFWLLRIWCQSTLQNITWPFWNFDNFGIRMLWPEWVGGGGTKV